MRLIMEYGDYRADGLGGFVRVTEEERLLHQALFLLKARRGGFAPLPEVGSRLYLLSREKPSQWEPLALAYAQEALDCLGLTVTAATVTATAEGLEVSIHAQGDGDEISLEAVIL